MKKYMLFKGDQFYPLGGFEDYVDTFDDFESAKSEALKITSEGQWFNIAENQNMKLVLSGLWSWGDDDGLELDDEY